MKQCIILILVIFLGHNASGQMRQFETARTKAVAGAGVASLSLTDGLYLNPASLSWFNQKLIGFQYSKNNDDLNQETKLNALSLIDTAALYQGGLAYEKREEFGVERKRYSTSFSKKASQVSSYGITYRYTKDSIIASNQEEKKHQLDIGYLRILSANLTFGFTASDVFDLDDKGSKGVIGFQYKLSSMLYALLDLGANLKEVKDSQSFSGALQVKILNDVYLRLGHFKNEQEALEGSSFGIGWYPHKFMIDLSVKNSQATDSNFANSPIAQGKKLKEINISVATRF